MIRQHKKREDKQANNAVVMPGMGSSGGVWDGPLCGQRVCSCGHLLRDNTLISFWFHQLEESDMKETYINK